MKTPHLVQYQGSKRNLAPYIAAYFPSQVHRLVEPFCGTCALSIYAGSEGLAESFLLNDLNSDVCDMMQACIETPQQLARNYGKIWQAQFHEDVDPATYFFSVRDQFNMDHEPEQMLFMLARVVKGAIRYNGKGEMNQSCDKRRKGTQPLTILKNALGISEILKGRCSYSSLDYKEVLKQCQPGDLVYMDPPYQGTSSRRNGRYIEGVNYDEFIQELDALNQKGIPYMLSYDGSTGSKKHGKPLPESLQLVKIDLEAGRSAQSTLLGKNETTIESLYLSPVLAAMLTQEGRPPIPA